MSDGSNGTYFILGKDRCINIFYIYIFAMQWKIVFIARCSRSASNAVDELYCKAEIKKMPYLDLGQFV